MSRLSLFLGALAILFAAGATPVAAQPAPEAPAATSPPAPEPPAAEPAPSEPPPVQPLESGQPAPASPPSEAPAAAPASTKLSAKQFQDELVGVPLCGVPPTGPLAGKILCTVHLPDGIAVVAGSGVLVRGLWEMDDGQVCRRSRDDPLERRRCVTYERLADDRYRNSDGVEVCRGPCGQ